MQKLLQSRVLMWKSGTLNRESEMGRFFNFTFNRTMISPIYLTRMGASQSFIGAGC